MAPGSAIKAMRLLLAPLVFAALSTSCVAPNTGMTQDAYHLYLQRFSAGDDRYADMYDDNVVFTHDPKFGTLRGRQAILDFYRKIRLDLKETVQASMVVIDNEQGVMAAELTTQLVAIRDGVEMPSGRLNMGDTIISRGTVYYGLRDGRIITIRASIDGHDLLRRK